jgi:hypothetical protein
MKVKDDAATLKKAAPDLLANAQSPSADPKNPWKTYAKESTSSPLKFMRWWNVLRNRGRGAGSRVNPTCGVKPGHDGSIERGSLSRKAPRVKFRPAQFHIVASQLPCVGRKLRPQQAWVHSVGNRGCIYWPFSGPSEPPCRTAAIDRSCTICAARGRSGSSVTADKPV